MDKTKIKKILGAVVLCGLFMTAVALFSTFYSKKEGEKEIETTKKYVQARQPAKSSEIGQDVEADGCVFHVKTAELTVDYDALDAYYQKRDYLSRPLEFVEALESLDDEWAGYQVGQIFPEEVKYIHLNFTVTNQGDSKRTFLPLYISLSSKNQYIGKGSYYGHIRFNAYDGRYTLTGDSDREIEIKGVKAGEINGDDILEEKIFIEPGETLEVDFVGEFFEYAKDLAGERYDYDLYLHAYGMGVEDVETNGERIRLNLTRGYAQEEEAKQLILYDEVKDIQGMKARSWTNLELAERKTEVYPRTDKEQTEAAKRGETEETGQEYLRMLYVTKGIDNMIQSAYKLSSKLTAVQVAEWKDISEEYKEKGNLQQMAQRYQSIYGCSEDELKVMLLDITYSAEAMGNLLENNKTETISFYNNSYLYTKESEGAWKLFGTADDWRVTDNSENPENIGWLNMQDLTVDNSISVQMAYILPPALYDKCDALYFAGGWLWNDSGYDTKVPLTRIALR